MKAGFDTNLLIYLVTNQDEDKRRRVEDLWKRTGKKFVPYQVLQEFIWVLKRKLGLGYEQIRSLLLALKREAEIGVPDFKVIEQAQRFYIKYKFQYWDSYVVAESFVSCCNVLYSEDMQDGLKVGDTLIIRNPFLTLSPGSPFP